jgi:hypothetical protein
MAEKKLKYMVWLQNCHYQLHDLESRQPTLPGAVTTEASESAQTRVGLDVWADSDSDVRTTARSELECVVLAPSRHLGLGPPSRPTLPAAILNLKRCTIDTQQGCHRTTPTVSVWIACVALGSGGYLAA